MVMFLLLFQIVSSMLESVKVQQCHSSFRFYFTSNILSYLNLNNLEVLQIEFQLLPLDLGRAPLPLVSTSVNFKFIYMSKEDLEVHKWQERCIVEYNIVGQICKSC